jgi:glycosyltransferase involved in cell wall biosynthesis
LQRVFARHGLASEVIPNSVDLSLFAPRPAALPANAPTADTRPASAPVHLVVTRNLETIYDIPTALRTFARVRQQVPSARLTVAGSGPELDRLQALAQQLHIAPAVVFTGRLPNAEMAALLRSASCLLNTSQVDNMPVSVLEAFACGVPVVSTRAGGIPDMLQDGVTGLLAGVGDDAALATQVLRVLGDAGLAAHLRKAGLAEAQKYSWPRVKTLWLRAYCRAAAAACTAGARA